MGGSHTASDDLSFQRESQFYALLAFGEPVVRGRAVLVQALLLDTLRAAEESVEQVGYVSTAIQAKLERFFGEGGVTQCCASQSQLVLQMLKKRNGAPGKDAKSKAEVTACRAAMLKVLKTERDKREAGLLLAHDREQLGTDAIVRTLSLPDAEAMNRILRYETTIERQLYKAMNHLERLQRQRKGDHVPPPLTVSVS